MRIKNYLLMMLPVFMLIGLVGWRFMKKDEQAEELTQQAGQRGGGPPAVEIGIAGPNVITTGIEAVGNAESPFRVEISPKTSGRIEYLQVREGDIVNAGDVLVRIDPSEVQASVLQQQANVAEARSRLAQAQLNQGPTEVGVQSQIQQQRAGLTSSEAELDQIERNYEAQVASADANVSDAQARVASAEAQVRNAQAELQRQQANLTNAETRHSRIDGLYKQGFIAAQEVDDSKTAVEVQRKSVDVARGQVDAAQASLNSAKAVLKSAENQASIARRKGLSDIAAAKARVSQSQASVKVADANRAQTPAYRQNVAALQASVGAAEAQLQQARVRLSETTLKAPISGVITTRSADPGALASPGQPVLVLQQMDWLYVNGSVPLSEASAVQAGKEVQVTFEGLPNRVFVGPITHVNPAADIQSRKIMFRVKLVNSDQAIKPGMFGRIAIPTQRIQAAVTVPKEAVRVDNGRATVVVVDSENKAQTREVQLGAQDQKFSQILSGLEPGDRIVTMTYRSLRDGQEVTLPGQGGSRGEGGGGSAGSGGGRPGGSRP